MLDIQKYREEFPITKIKTFLNHAGVSPLAKPVSRVIQACLKKTAVQEEYPFNEDESIDRSIVQVHFVKNINGELHLDDFDKAVDNRCGNC